MKSKQFMFIAGDPSGDALAAELVVALRERLGGATFFGAGGAKLAAAGVDLEFDLTQHAVIGLWEVVKKLLDFRRLFRRLLETAVERRPDVIVCVDFSGFNRRFASAVRREVARRKLDWSPRIIQYVSPQVWASRPGRAVKMARDIDLLLTILPFEKAWYAERVPDLKVEFVGHPIVERHAGVPNPAMIPVETAEPTIVLLPGSRPGELRRHWPALVKAWKQIHENAPRSKAVAVFPFESLRVFASSMSISPPRGLTLQVGELATALRGATIAMASTGTVTLECAYFRVPTVTFYKTSWLTYQIAKRIVTVPSLTMPNLLAKESVFPEFVQGDATPERLAAAATALLDSPAERTRIRGKLDAIVASLGQPGASHRAADAILALLPDAGASR